MLDARIYFNTISYRSFDCLPQVLFMRDVVKHATYITLKALMIFTGSHETIMCFLFELSTAHFIKTHQLGVITMNQ